MSAMRADNRRLTETVTELRAERRAQERKLRDLQHQLDIVRAKLVTSVMDAAPPLPVEVVAPPSQNGVASRVVGVTEDGTEIVYEGEAALGRSDDEPAPAPRNPRRAPPPSTADSLGTTARIPPVAARRAPTRDAKPTERGGAAENDYRVAVDLVKAGKHDEAVAALRTFVSRYPQHDYADNAQYWLGESYYAAKDYPRALVEFRTVIETYPRGNKVPDALLKVGYCYQAMGQTQKARAVLEQVVNLYPKTEPAAIAAKKLETP